MENQTGVRDESSTQTEQKANSPFAQDSWSEATVESTTEQSGQEQNQQQETQQQTTEQQQSAPVEWFKEFGFDSEEVAKTEVAELRKLKENPPPAKEIEFANEDSKRLFEYIKDGKEEDVLSLLSQKKQLEKLTKIDITDDTAGDIIKLAMQQKYKDLSPDEIEYKYKKQFSIPKEPVKGELEDDDEFSLKHGEWQERVNEIKKERIIEAKLARPELEKLKSELVLPNIQKEGEQSSQDQQQQKELAQAEIDKRRDLYLKSLSSDYKNFNGFETSYKSEGVDIPVSYSVTEEEKATLKTELETFDVDGFILGRWFNADGSPNVKTLMKDVYLLRNEDKIHQKIANETGAKVLDNYIKNVKNVNVTGGAQHNMNLNDNKTENEKIGSFFAGM